MNNLEDALRQFMASNPDLPDGDDLIVAEEPKPRHNKACKLQVIIERKGRGGKTATIVTGFTGMDDDEIAGLARRLKTRLGSGGSSRGGEILIQGERRREVVELLREEGFKVNG